VILIQDLHANLASRTAVSRFKQFYGSFVLLLEGNINEKAAKQFNSLVDQMKETDNAIEKFTN